MNMTNTMLRESDYVRTADLPLAAFLAIWFPVEAIERQNGNKAYFLFLRNEELNQQIKSYWRGAAWCEPMAYFNSIKQLKSRIYAE